MDEISDGRVKITHNNKPASRIGHARHTVVKQSKPVFLKYPFKTIQDRGFDGHEISITVHGSNSIQNSFGKITIPT
jgi:hypothetical protein